MCWYGGGVAPAAPPPICRMHSWEPEPGGERWSVITTGSNGTRANEDPSRPGGSHWCGRAFSQVGAVDPVSIDFWPAELSVRRPRLDRSMEASIQEGRRGGAISDG
jgi:hypothetical protein